VQRRTFFAGVAASLLIAGSALPAAAHTGAGSHVYAASDALTAGFTHPFNGLDHLAAMVAVGVLARLAGGRNVWVWPAAFAGLMITGGVLARAGLALPQVEPLIAVSVVVLGVMVVAGAQASLPVAGVVALFGIAHGQAHGLAAPAGGFAAHAVGFAAATALLHLTGIGLATGLARIPNGIPAARFAGGLTAALGLLLMVRLP
jgi:urease accessory protein